MRLLNLIVTLLLTGLFFSCSNYEINPLVGTWEMTSSEYTLPSGEPDTSINFISAMRIYNDSHFSVFYEYADGNTEACFTSYELEGSTISFKIIHHSSSQMVGMDLQGETKVEGNTLTHQMDMDGYKIFEEYKKIE